ncbi:MAG: hypothetical protein IPN50_11200 [Sphingomonadales bacterium]|nr:hypothetical protein [Sphingomonadales bacterium]
MHHPVTWAAPRPLWSAGGGRGLPPSILRFASDDFMEQLIACLENDPGKLGDYVAKPETWRSPQGSGQPSDLIDRVPLPAPLKKSRFSTRLKTAPIMPPPVAPVTQPLKLFQPAHQRFYVVTATLACALPGMPDRKPEGAQESVGYVLRRLLPAGTNGPLVEHGFVKDAAGPRWQRLAGDDPSLLAPGEEIIGVFPLNHRDGNGLRRSLWGGMVPVARREEYLAASVANGAPSLVEGQIAALGTATAPARANSKLARLSELRMDFIEPWKAMVQSAIKAAADIRADTGDDSSDVNRQKQLRERNLQYQTQSWLLLADFWSFLGRHMTALRDAIRGQSDAGLSTAERDLFQWVQNGDPQSERDTLKNGFKPFDGSASQQPAYQSSLGNALRQLAGANETEFAANVAKLEANELLYTASQAEKSNWPGFHYLLAGIGSDGVGAANSISAIGPYSRVGSAPTPPVTANETRDTSLPLTTPPQSAGFDANILDQIAVMVGRALPNNDEAAARPMPFAQQLSQTLQNTNYDTGLFVIRFVHMNADCGPLHPPTLSAPTERFKLANFFDPDAPARPIRITLPSDTSAAGLRKHAKGTAFVLSDMLCGQVQRAKGLGFVDLVRQVLPWPLHKDIDIGAGGGCKSGELNIGMICSISIPIITLCALILLMIIVSLLDFIFRWIPWFIMCFPVPGLKGKPQTGGSP